MTASRGAASAGAVVSPASQSSCGTSRTSTLALLLMGPPTPCPWRLSASLARRPGVEGFDARVPEYATGVARPTQEDPVRLATSPWDSWVLPLEGLTTPSRSILTTTLDLFVGLPVELPPDFAGFGRFQAVP